MTVWERNADEAVRLHNKTAKEMFNNLINAGVCREQARGVLPQSMYTEYYASANLNNILKFIDLRTHEGAQWEIQEMAKGMLKIIEKLYPVTVGAYREIRGA
jgi:thymidylate synthase (FAD)